MHRSRLAGFIIDCQTDDLQGATQFWSRALGMEKREVEPPYVDLNSDARDLVIAVQTVSHPSRVHLDIESDDVEAEVARLEKLGAVRVEKIKTWWVMESPTKQRFCVIRAKADLSKKPGANSW